MAYKKQKGGPKMYRKDGALPMKSPMKNINNMKAYSKPGDAVQFGDGIKMHGDHDGPKMYGSPNEMEKTPTYMKSGFKMKSGSPFQRNFGIGASPVKAAKPDYPDIDGDGNTTESMKQAAADKKAGGPQMQSPMKRVETYDLDFVKQVPGGNAKASSRQELLKQYKEAQEAYQRGGGQQYRKFMEKYPTAADYAASVDWETNQPMGDVMRKESPKDFEQQKQTTYQKGAMSLRDAIQDGTVSQANLEGYIEEGFTGDDRQAIMNELVESGLVKKDFMDNIRASFKDRDENPMTWEDNQGNMLPDPEGFGTSEYNLEGSKDEQKRVVMESLRKRNEGASKSDLEKLYAEYLEDLKTKAGGENLDTRVLDQDLIDRSRKGPARKEEKLRMDSGLKPNEESLTIG